MRIRSRGGRRKGRQGAGAQHSPSGGDLWPTGSRMPPATLAAAPGSGRRLGGGAGRGERAGRWGRGRGVGCWAARAAGTGFLQPQAQSVCRPSVHSPSPAQDFACSPTVPVSLAATKRTGRSHLILFTQFWLRPELGGRRPARSRGWRVSRCPSEGLKRVGEGSSLREKRSEGGAVPEWGSGPQQRGSRWPSWLVVWGLPGCSVGSPLSRYQSHRCIKTDAGSLAQGHKPENLRL